MSLSEVTTRTARQQIFERVRTAQTFRHLVVKGAIPLSRVKLFVAVMTVITVPYEDAFP